MNIRQTLLTSASVLVLSAGVASANGSQAYVEQDGVDNSAEITQQVGGSPGHRAGFANSPITQDGDNNQATILQRFQWNNTIVATGGQFRQQGDRNIANITQGITGIGAAQNLVVGTVTQIGESGAAATQNQLTIRQAGGASRTNAYQENGVAGGAPNIGSIWMTGAQSHRSIFGDPSVAIDGGLFQIGAGNNADVVMRGRGALGGNLIREVRQEGSTNTANVSLGTIAPSVAVAGNGLIPLSGASAVVSAGSIYSVRSSIFEQYGDLNSLNMLVTGDSNSFGVYQRGDSNSIGSVLIPGNGNSLGILQLGEDITGVAKLDGNDNNVGILQEGNTNNVNLDITGSDNGFPALFFDGAGPHEAALTVATDQGLTSGLMEQFGNDNTMNVTINGSSNAFGMRQGTSSLAANNNTIIGTIDGSNNAVAVAQLSSGNMVDFSQTGSSNSLGIVQN